MKSSVSREHDLALFAFISWVMRGGVYLSLVIFALAAALRIFKGGWGGPYLPVASVFTAAAWSAPGDVLLWAGVLVLGLTPLVSLFVVWLFSLVRRRMFDLAVSSVIFLMFIVSYLLGI